MQALGRSGQIAFTLIYTVIDGEPARTGHHDDELMLLPVGVASAGLPGWNIVDRKDALDHKRNVPPTFGDHQPAALVRDLRQFYPLDVGHAIPHLVPDWGALALMRACQCGRWDSRARARPHTRRRWRDTIARFHSSHDRTASPAPSQRR